MPSDADACGTAASGVSTRCARSLARSTSGAESEPPGATALQGRRADTPPVRRMPRRVPRHPLQFGSRVVGSGRAGGGQPGPNDRQRLPHPNCKADAATRHRCDGCHGVSPGNCKADAATRHRCDGCHGVSPGIPCSSGRLRFFQLGQVEVVGRVGSGPRREPRPDHGPHPNCKADGPTRRRCDGCDGVSPGIPCSSGRLPGRASGTARAHENSFGGAGEPTGELG